MRRPKENPEDKQARLTERRMTEVERRAAAEDTAARLGSDLRSVYGFGGMMPSIFSPTIGRPSTPTTRPGSTTIGSR